MSFQLECPNCGKRAVSEFTFRGELTSRPDARADFSAWTDYVFMRDNKRGEQAEWWYHRGGCKRWFMANRDTNDNTQQQCFWFKDRHNHLEKSK